MIRIHIQKGNQHGADDGGSAHPGKAGAKPCTDACDEADDQLYDYLRHMKPLVMVKCNQIIITGVQEPVK